MKRTGKRFLCALLAGAMLLPASAVSAADGSVKTAAEASDDGWHEDSKGTFYLEDGERLTGWQKIGGEKSDYHFGEDGYLTTGWFQDMDDNGNWYYLSMENDSYGLMQRGWITDETGWKVYYLDSNGRMLKDKWIEARESDMTETSPVVSGGLYKLGSDGAVQMNGWAESVTPGIWWFCLPHTGLFAKEDAPSWSAKDLGDTKPHKFLRADYKAPTCEAEGFYVLKCSECDFNMRVYPPALGHSWDKGVVTKEPTEGEIGRKVYTCGRCGETKTEWLPTSGESTGEEHDYQEIFVMEAACTEDGYTLFECADCGAEYRETIPALGHDWDEGVVTKEPEANTPGEKTYTCKRCEESRIEELPPTGGSGHTHSYQPVITTDPTCTGEGNTIFKCTACGSEYTKTSPALGHDWDEGEVTKAPTCVRKGEKTYTCERCGITKKEKLDATGEHMWEHHDAVTKTERVLIEEAGETPVYEWHTLCMVCGKDFGTSADDAVHQAGLHSVGADGLGCYGNYTTKQVVVDTIYHDAVYEDREVIVEPAYDECTVCHTVK